MYVYKRPSASQLVFRHKVSGVSRIFIKKFHVPMLQVKKYNDTFSVIRIRNTHTLIHLRIYRARIYMQTHIHGHVQFRIPFFVML